MSDDIIAAIESAISRIPDSTGDELKLLLLDIHRGIQSLRKDKDLVALDALLSAALLEKEDELAPVQHEVNLIYNIFVENELPDFGFLVTPQTEARRIRKEVQDAMDELRLQGVSDINTIFEKLVDEREFTEEEALDGINHDRQERAKAFGEDPAQAIWQPRPAAPQEGNKLGLEVSRRQWENKSIVVPDRPVPENYYQGIKRFEEAPEVKQRSDDNRKRSERREEDRIRDEQLRRDNQRREQQLREENRKKEQRQRDLDRQKEERQQEEDRRRENQRREEQRQRDIERNRQNQQNRRDNNQPDRRDNNQQDQRKPWQQERNQPDRRNQWLPREQDDQDKPWRKPAANDQVDINQAVREEVQRVNEARPVNRNNYWDNRPPVLEPVEIESGSLEASQVDEDEELEGQITPSYQDEPDEEEEEEPHISVSLS